MDLLNNEKIIEVLTEYVSLYGLKGLGALLILVFGYFGTKLCVSVLRRILQKSRLDKILVSFGTNTLKTLLLLFVGISALNQLGFQTTSLVAIVGAAGLAIALAFKDSLSNLASGVMIIIFRPFKIGHYIETSAGSGTVEDVHIFTTRLKTPDGRIVIVPNASLTSSSITNFSDQPTRRIDLLIGIGYGDDIKKAKKVLQDIVHKDARIKKEPEPFIAVMDLGESSVNLAVRIWVDTADFFVTKCALTENIKLSFDKKGISIPYPQRDIHLIDVPDKIGT